MKVYSPSEVAEILKIKQATLRKYSIMLEERGYKVNRNSQNHRYYHDKDIITLRRIIEGKNSGVTLEESVNNVISIESDNTYTNDTNNGVQPYDSVIADLKEEIHRQSEDIERQNALVEELIKRLDAKDKQENERDKILMQLHDDMLTRKQIAIAEEKKKGFFQRLFRK